MPSFMRKFIDLVWYKGPIHEPIPDGNYSELRDGIANNIDTIRDSVKATAFIRNPEKTPIFTDLQREYGQSGNANLSQDEQIRLLKQARYRRRTNATDDDLQKILDDSGFDLTVYNNSPDGPAIDPAIILTQNFQMQAQNGTNYYAGNTEAYAGRLGGVLIVNGPIFTQAPAYFGCGDVWAGNDNARAGYFEKLFQILIKYDIPTDPDDWPLVFFVGGDATFAGDGSILTIEQGFVSNEQREKLENIILQFKPQFTWCGLVVTFT